MPLRCSPYPEAKNLIRPSHSSRAREPKSIPLDVYIGCLSSSTTNFEDNLGPPNDPVGAALGLEDDEDPAQAWEEVMDMFAKLAVKSYYESQRRKRAGS